MIPKRSRKLLREALRVGNHKKSDAVEIDEIQIPSSHRLEAGIKDIAIKKNVILIIEILQGLHEAGFEKDQADVRQTEKVDVVYFDKSNEVDRSSRIKKSNVKRMIP